MTHLIRRILWAYVAACAAWRMYPDETTVVPNWTLKIGDGTINIHPDGSATLPIADGGFAPVTVAKEVVSRYESRL